MNLVSGAPVAVELHSGVQRHIKGSGLWGKIGAEMCVRHNSQPADTNPHPTPVTTHIYANVNLSKQKHILIYLI